MSLGLSQFDCYPSYLPATHVFEQALFAASMIYGMKCGFFSGDVTKLLDDLAVLKPTIFPSVPRLFNKIHSTIIKTVSEKEGCGGWLLRKAVDTKLHYWRAGQGCYHAFYDRLIFSKIKAKLGGNVRFMVTGSAPISGEVLDFLKIAFCCNIVEGYGMTETTASGTVSWEDDPMQGIVGGPTQCTKIKLRDIPEMGYLHTNEVPTGELCIGGSIVTKGYFKNPEKTAEAFVDGWVMTGDVGAVLANGAIKIFDRAKNIFKLSQGEYIAPEKLENVYITCSFAAQVWIYGDSIKDHIVMFMVVEEAAVKKWAAERNLGDDASALLENEELKMTILKEISALGDANQFNSLEKPKQMMLLLEPFSVENDMLTPTFKLKRAQAKKNFAK